MCAAGRGNCNSNTADGCESTLSTDVTNCGACGTNCNNLEQVATATCVASACNVTACNAGFANCDMMSGNGCETNTSSDAANCGACGAVCGASNTLNNTCLSGRCNCAAGFRDCNASRTDGCEIDRLTDNNNCGECGVVCPSGQGCDAGTCTMNCGASGQPCCAGAMACNGGLTCTNRVCTP